MAITIRNKALEADIRALGAKAGKGPTDLLRQLVEEKKVQVALEEKAQEETWRAERVRALDELLAMASSFMTDEIRADMQRAMDEMYDEDGLPR